MIANLFVNIFAILVWAHPNQTEQIGGTWVQAPVKTDGVPVYFSVPTLCDGMPESETLEKPCNLFVMHEDNWRQIEFVPASNRDLIDQMLKSFVDGV